MLKLIFVSCLLFVSSIGFAETSIQEFFAHPEYEQATLSPDGVHFAIKTNSDGDGRLIIYRTEDVQPVAIFKAEERREIGDFWWVNNERVVLNQTFSVGSLDFPLHTGELFALSIDNTRKFAIAGWAAGDQQGAFEMLQPMTESKRKIRVVRRSIKGTTGVSQSKPIAYTLDTYLMPKGTTGSRLSENRFKQKVNSPYPWGRLVADRTGEVRLAYYVNRDGYLEMSERVKGKWLERPDLLPSNSSALADLHPVVGFDKKNKGVYSIAKNKNGSDAVYYYEFKSQERTLLFESDQFDISDLIFSSDDELIGVTLLGAYPETYFFSDHPDVGLVKSLFASFPYQFVSVDFSTDGRFALLNVMSDQNPGSLYLFDRKAGNLKLLIKAHSQIDVSQMKNRDPFQLRTKDGLDLVGIVTLPAPEAKNSPTVVLVHGGPHGVFDSYLFDAEAQYFASLGYAVIQVNFRGSGGYGSELLDAGIGQWTSGMIDDIALASRWAIQQGIANSEKICVYGASYGALAALTSVAQHSELYRCAIGYAGIYNLSRMKDKKNDLNFLPDGEAYMDLVIGTDLKKLRDGSPVFNAERINQPVFLAHGGEDSRAPLFHAEEMRAALEKAGNSPEWLVYDGEGHGFYKEEHIVEFYRRVGQFLERHLR